MMRILLVEDDAGLQGSLAGILRDAGYAVDVSGDGDFVPAILAIKEIGKTGANFATEMWSSL